MKAIALFVVAGLATAAQADIVAYWNFNGAPSAPNTFNSGQVGPLTLAPAQGAGTITLNGLTLNTAAATAAANGTVGSFGGSTLNAITPDVAGQALAVTGGVAGTGTVVANQGQLIFALNLIGFGSDLTLSYVTRGTSTGFTSQAWSYSTDGGTSWVNTTSFSGALTATYVLRNVVIPATSTPGSIYGNANFLVRLTVDGASNASGNNRIDNVRFDATVPTPGAATLMGLGLVAAGRRRR